ncbi:MAG: glycosyltransferase [Gemmatimonadaceae bacterium]|nr:glycosyltransferase [Gemmatimonadaceae bacterium]
MATQNYLASHSERAPSISVVICSRDRPRQLERALRAIAPALRATDDCLVVLNAQAEDVHSYFRERFPFARFVLEPRPGLDWARNRALIEGRSDVLLFTDDDCVPDASWIDAYRRLFDRNPDVDVATGLVEPLELATPAQVLFESYGGFARGYVRRWIHAPRRARVATAVGNVGSYGTGANLAIRRRFVERMGPFDAALGVGTRTGGGDDLEMIFRALKVGALLAYEPRAIVRRASTRT